ncbi:alpha/beta fold hydrolase [Rhodococcus koreensis]
MTADKITSSPTVWGALGTVASTVRYLDVGGWRTRVLEAGTGEPLVLMHGTGGHLEAFAHNIGPLSQHYRVIAFDFPGHGFSSLADTDLEIADYSAHLLGLLDTLQIERAHLMGESLGGWLAAKFAPAHRDRVASAILNTPGGRRADPVVMNRIYTLTMAAVENPTPTNVRTRLEWLMANPDSVTDELVDIRRRIYSREGFVASMKHILCLQQEEPRQRNLISDEELAAISCPTLVVWTSDDPSAPASVGEKMTATIPRGEFAYLTEAGHWPQWEQSTEYNKLVLRFLQKVRA